MPYNYNPNQPPQGIFGGSPQPGGIWGPVRGFLGNHSNALMQAGLGLLGGDTTQEGFRNAARGLAVGTEQDQTAADRKRAEADRKKLDDALAGLASDPSGPMAGLSGPVLNYARARPELMDSIITDRTKTRDPVGPKYMNVDGRVFNENTGQFMEDGSAGVSGDGQHFRGNNPDVQAVNAMIDAGKITYLQGADYLGGKVVTNPENNSLNFQSLSDLAGGGGGITQPQTQQQPGQQQPSMGGKQLTPGRSDTQTETQRNRRASVNSAVSAIEGELGRYETLIGKYGVEAAPGAAKDQLNTVRQGIMLQLKELFNLGVLNGPDLSLMEKMIWDPSVDVTKEGGMSNLPGQVYTGTVGGASGRAATSAAELRRMIQGIRQSVETGASGGTDPNADPFGIR